MAKHILTKQIIEREWFEKGISKKEFAQNIGYNANSIGNFCRRNNIIISKYTWDKKQGVNNYSLQDKVGCCEYLDKCNNVWIVEVYSSNPPLQEVIESILTNKGIKFSLRRKGRITHNHWSLRITNFRFEVMKNILENYNLFKETLRLKQMKTCSTKHDIPPKSKDSGILPNLT